MRTRIPDGATRHRAGTPTSRTSALPRSGAPGPHGRRGSGANRSSAPAPGASAPLRRRGALLAAGLALLVAVLLVAVPLATDDGAAVTPDPERVAELRSAEAQRDAAQVVELTTLARETRDALLPVVEGLAGALPFAAGEPVRDAGAAEVAGWSTTVAEAAIALDDPPSGATNLNVARAGLTVAVDTLASAVQAYATALDAPSADEAQRWRLLAADLRTQAVIGWSVGATQLDVVTIDAGRGHTHVFLPAAPGSGALGPDPAPEGSEQ